MMTTTRRRRHALELASIERSSSQRPRLHNSISILHLLLLYSIFTNSSLVYLLHHGDCLTPTHNVTRTTTAAADAQVSLSTEKIASSADAAELLKSGDDQKGPTGRPFAYQDDDDQDEQSEVAPPTRLTIVAEVEGGHERGDYQVVPRLRYVQRRIKRHSSGATGTTASTATTTTMSNGKKSKHFIPKGAHISAHQLDNCYYHAKSSPNANDSQPRAIGAFRTCNGLSGIIHVNNESLVIHPFFNSDSSKKQPHIIYRYQTGDSMATTSAALNGNNNGGEQAAECANDWSLRQFKTRIERQPAVMTQQPEHATRTSDTTMAHKRVGRDVGLLEKYIELGLVLSKDMFSKRNTSSRLEVLHDAIQIINCLDLYFRRSANTRVGIVYIETWAHGDQIEITSDPKQTLYNFLDYTTRHLYGTHRDAVHLLTGGHGQQFDSNAFGMSLPDSVCTTQAVSVSQEASILEPFVTAATIAHLLGHNLGLEHDNEPSPVAAPASPSPVSIQQRQQQFATVPALPVLAAARRRGGGLITGGARAGADGHGSGDSEGEEDEIKGRSVDAQLPVESGPSPGNWYDQDLQQLEDGATSGGECTTNCIMNQRFVYAQPPVALGNMIQQQQQTTDQDRKLGPVVSSFSFQETEQQQLNNSSSVDTQEFNFGASSVLSGQTTTPTGHSNLPSLPFKFSRRSIRTYIALLREGRNFCLWNKPNSLETSIVPTCGNGIVERDEDCDCGTRSDCWADTCCERVTCKFRQGVECISGACCERCKFRPRGHVCRKSRGECDLPEQCDGKSYSCGPDLHKQNGHSCGLNQGYCYMGQCPQHDLQCVELWGAHARNSERECYANLNTNGTIFGNCGPRGGGGGVGGKGSPQGSGSGQSRATSNVGTSKLKRCEQEHIMCGTLQCQLGDMKPVTAELDTNSNNNNQATTSNTAHAYQRFLSGGGGESTSQSISTYEYSRKILRQNGHDYECKVITKPVINNHHHRNQAQQQQQVTATISYVRDGSKCAEQRVCFNQTCQPLERVYADAYELCPRDERGNFCSQHGVCSTANRCHCDEGWAGDDCSQAWVAPLAETIVELPVADVHHQVQMNLTRAVNNLSQYFLAAVPTTTTTTTTSAPLVNVTEVHTTNTSTSTAPPPPPTHSPPAPAQQSQTTNYQAQDKSKHDALSAHTLVFILVSIVAAVYVGFAIMANCYRRKGFLKPDKVLRHHQMNCRLDAMRSSFIAKRLALADVDGTGGVATAFTDQTAGLPSSISGPAGADEPLSPPLPFVSPTDSGAAAAVPVPPPPPEVLNQYVQQRHQQPQPLQATVHYYDQRPTDLHNNNNNSANFGYNDATGSGDHIPLLGGGGAGSRGFNNGSSQQHFTMRPFSTHTRALALDRRLQPVGRSTQVPPTQVQNPRQMSALINRAISLGNVSRQQSLSREANDELQMGATAADSQRSAALATPSRAPLHAPHLSSARHHHHHHHHAHPHHRLPHLNPMNFQFAAPTTGSRAVQQAQVYQQQHEDDDVDDHLDVDELDDADGECLLQPIELDSCSMKSSPDRVYWNRNQQQQQQQRYHEGALMDAMSARPCHPLRHQQHSIERQQQPPPLPAGPPPPPPLDMSPASTPPPPPPPHKVEAPVNNVLTDDKRQFTSQDAGRREPSTIQAHQLSLIAQLQQLEQVQSLHQKQVAAQQQGVVTGLHEFFSLPLSVQLSALLARNLATATGEPAMSANDSQSHIDEYLNLLNSSSVAVSSRRSFKSVGRPQQQATTSVVSKPLQSTEATEQPAGSSRGGTLRKQQVKLANLQSLIERLQKLHSQTMLQQLEANDDDDDDDDDDGDSEQHSDVDENRTVATNRKHRQQPLPRRTSGQVNDEDSMARRESSTPGRLNRTRAPPVRRSDSQRSRQEHQEHQHQHHQHHHQTNYNAASNRNDLVYSMSDSEDGGAYVAQMLTRTSKYLNQQQRANSKPNINVNVASRPELLGKSQKAPSEDNASTSATTPSVSTDVSLVANNSLQPQQQTNELPQASAQNNPQTTNNNSDE